MRRVWAWCAWGVLLCIGIVASARGEQVNSGRLKPDASTMLITALQMPGSPLTPDFTLTLSQSALSVAQGKSGAMMVRVGDENGFSSLIGLSCMGMPPGTMCIFSPSVLNTGGTAKLTVTAASSVAPDSTPSAPTMGTMGAVLITGLGLIGTVLSTRGKERANRQLTWRFLWIALLVSLTLAAGACGYSSKNMTTMGTQNVMVVATSGMVAHTAVFSLTVM